MTSVYRLLAIGWVPLLVFLVACIEPQLYESKEGRFSVAMPGSPELSTRTVNDPSLGPREVHIAQSRIGEGGFAVAYSDISEEFADLVGSTIILDGIRDGLLAIYQGNLLSEQIVSLDGHPGRLIEATIRVGVEADTLSAYVYFVGTRLYRVYWIGPSENRFSSDVDRFFASFKLTGNVPVRAEDPNQENLATRLVAPGLQEFIDSAGNFSIVIPADWTIDLEFGRNVLQEFAGLGAPLKFYAGRPIPGGYEPSIFVLGSFVPDGTDWDAFIEETIRFETSAPGGIGTERVDRESLGELFGGIAEQVTYLDRPDYLFSHGFETFAVYLLKGNRTWSLYCAANRELVAEMETCKEAIKTFKLER